MPFARVATSRIPPVSPRASSETLAAADDMAQNVPWQFAGNLQKWAGKWNDLPVDQHMLIALSALLDGLWVELSLSSETFKPREAIGICEDWVNALCAGAFPRILREKLHKP